MKEINQTRLTVLKEIKKIQRFFNDMEKGVKSRDPDKIYAAYAFLRNLMHQMSEGDLTPFSVELTKRLYESGFT